MLDRNSGRKNLPLTRKKPWGGPGSYEESLLEEERKRRRGDRREGQTYGNNAFFTGDEGIFSKRSDFISVKQESREDAVVLAAGVDSVPVSEGLHPHLVALGQPQQHQAGGLVDVLTVQGIPRPHLSGAIHHQRGSKRLAADGDVEGEDVNPGVNTREAVGSEVEVVFFIVEDFVKSDWEA